MVRRTYNLPALTTLGAFEVAARHGSFKLAADELNVTPGAVSHQVKALEQDLGAALFLRVHRGVSLTDEGRILLSALQTSFRTMSAALDQIRHTTRDRAITVTATTAVSSLWLTPRITRFWRKHPDVRVNQIVSDKPGTGPVRPDLTIFYGEPAEMAQHAKPLFDDYLVPLAAPGFRIDGDPGDLPTLAQSPLIHLNAEDHRWTRWHTWFSGLGYDGRLSRGTQVNNYMIALQAAQDGAGLVLGWERLVAPLLENGSLVTVGPHRVKAPSRFYVQKDPQAQHDAHVDLLENWLLEMN